ncbi:SDR family oxidoreductase [Occallatibacter riparius]|uniref:SDR family NAD(P)-dependent oxidoreductase n=1 Tax=Occallatibacter riparius TaxID=1002689 RepID=A0A9J7BMU5_9BACT|nr:NmrA family NAD(P)-binding protein [Occallatibacter riparius]UWZ84204.1 SDR family NAD(P)-dependent oxidoreductase [Occallatibacter riparius]
MKILVTGATGNVGREVVKNLLNRGVEVRALARKPESVSFPAGVEVVQGDLTDPESVRAAVNGVDKLFLLNAVVADELTQALITYGIAKREGIKHVTYVSVYKADHFRDVPHFASKVAVENALHEFGVPYTVLRPGYFFQNDLTLKPLLEQMGIYPMPIGTAGISAIDSRDIAEAAAITLTKQGHEGQTYDLVSSSQITGPGNAALWSKALGKDIFYTGHDFDAWEKQMSGQLPGWMAYDMRTMLEGYVERGFASTEADVARVTKLLGHAPRTYEAFVQEAAAAWANKEQR